MPKRIKKKTPNPISRRLIVKEKGIVVVLLMLPNTVAENEGNPPWNSDDVGMKMNDDGICSTC